MVVCGLELDYCLIDLVAHGTNLCGRVLNKDVVDLEARLIVEKAVALAPFAPTPDSVLDDNLLGAPPPPCVRWPICCNCSFWACEPELAACTFAKEPSKGIASRRRLWKGIRVGLLDFSDREEDPLPLPLPPELLLLLPPPLLLLFELFTDDEEEKATTPVAEDAIAEAEDEDPRPLPFLLHLKGTRRETGTNHKIGGPQPASPVTGRRPRHIHWPL